MIPDSPIAAVTALVRMVALSLVISVAAAASGAEIEGVKFAPKVDVHGKSLVLNGYALLRYKVVFKGYVAALYLEPTTRPEHVLDDVAKRLEIEYFWGIDAADFATATIDGVAANWTTADVTRLRPAIDQFNGLYEDVKPGDRYALSYIPGIGTELALNGTRLGSVPGKDLAAAIFSIWLGEKPFDSGLKTALLGE